MNKSLALALMTLFTLSACGKSLHLTELKDPNKKDGKGDRVAVVAEEAVLAALTEAELKDEAVESMRKQLALKGADAPPADPVADPGKTADAGTAQHEGTTGFEVGPSVEDAAAVVEEAQTLYNLGTAQAKFTKDGKEIGYNKSAAVVMRAIFKLPADQKSVKKVKSLTLKLPKVRRFDSTETNTSSMAGQILCVVDGMLCSGEKSGLASGDALQVKSDLFAKGSALELEQALEGQEKVFASNAVMTIDLKAALGLTDQSAIDFLYSNTKELKEQPAASPDAGAKEGAAQDQSGKTESAKVEPVKNEAAPAASGAPAPAKQQRVLRLMLGNQTQVEGGSISIELE
jgi:hypothetical protein